MTNLTIKLPKKKAIRLGRHLTIEHPSTKGKIFVDNIKLKRRKK